MKPSSDIARIQPSSRREPEDSLFGAAAEVFSAGQQLILDRVDLLQAEVTSDVTQLVTATALFTSALTMALLGWTVLTAAFAVLLHRWLPLDAALATAGSVDLLLGILLGGLGYRRMSQPTSFDKPAATREASHV